MAPPLQSERGRRSPEPAAGAVGVAGAHAFAGAGGPPLLAMCERVGGRRRISRGERDGYAAAAPANHKGRLLSRLQATGTPSGGAGRFEVERAGDDEKNFVARATLPLCWWRAGRAQPRCTDGSDRG